MSARIVASACIAAAILGSAAWWATGDDGAAGTPAGDVTDGGPIASARAAQAPATGGATPLGTMTEAIAAERRALLERLTASADPRDAWRAYDLIHQCVDWQRAERWMARDPEARVFLQQAAAPLDGACIGVGDDARAGRLALLWRAAQASVPGAASALLNEGPRGDGRDLENPGVRAAWWVQVGPLLVAAAQAGDRSAVSMLSQVLENGLAGAITPDEAGALEYFTVEAELSRVRHGGVLSASFQGALDRLAARLPPDEAARARAAGMKLFVDAFQGKPAQ